MVVASAIIIIISSSIHNDDSKHFIITMISNLIEYSITEIVALYKFKTQFESNFHPKNVCVDYHRRSDVRQVPRIFLFVVNSLISISCVCVCVLPKKEHFFEVFIHHFTYTQIERMRESDKLQQHHRNKIMAAHVTLGHSQNSWVYACVGVCVSVINRIYVLRITHGKNMCLKL